MLLVTIQSGSSSDHFNISLPYLDKLTHFFVFGILGWLMARAIFKQDNTFLRQNYFWLVVVVIAIFALFDEIHQLYTPGRSTDSADWIADLSGAIFFLLLFKRKRIPPNPN